MRRQKVKLYVLLALVLLLLGIAAFAPYLVPFDPYEQNLSQALQAPRGQSSAGDRSVWKGYVVQGDYGFTDDYLLRAPAGGGDNTDGYVCGPVLRLAGRKAGFFDHEDIRYLFGFSRYGICHSGGGSSGRGNTQCGDRSGLHLLAKVRQAGEKPGAYDQRCPVFGRGQVVRIRGNKDCIQTYTSQHTWAVLVTATLDIGTMMMEIAGLSFLGLGAMPPIAEWGSMMTAGAVCFRRHRG